MSSIYHSIAPAIVALTLACGSAAAHAAGSSSNAGMRSVAQSNVETTARDSSADTESTEHQLTRREVYNQLVQAERDGTLARLNALYYGP